MENTNEREAEKLLAEIEEALRRMDNDSLRKVCVFIAKLETLLPKKEGDR